MKRTERVEVTFRKKGWIVGELLWTQKYGDETKSHLTMLRDDPLRNNDRRFELGQMLAVTKDPDRTPGTSTDTSTWVGTCWTYASIAPLTVTQTDCGDPSTQMTGQAVTYLPGNCADAAFL
jgi:hypothetical protein